MKQISKLFYILREDKRNFIFMMFVFILVSLLEALSIGLIGPFISLASNPSLIDRSSLLSSIYSQLSMSKSQFIAGVGMIIAIAFVVKSVLYFFSQIAIYRFSFGLQRKIELRLFDAYLLAPYTFYLSRNSAGIIKNISLETHKFTHGYLVPLLQGIANLFIVVVLTALLARTDLLLLSMILGGILPVFLLFVLFRKRIKHWGHQGSDALQEIIRVVNHGLGGFKETRVIGCEPYFMQQMNEQTLKLEASQLPFYVSQKVPRILLEALLIIPLVVFISVSQFSGNDSQSLIGTLSVFAVASIRLMPAASQFLMSLSSMQGNAYTVDALSYDLKLLEDNYKTDRQLEKVRKQMLPMLANGQQAGQHDSLSLKHYISLDNVVYRYPESVEPALNNISLTIKRGQSVAFIGKSGSGKTTLVDVILGLLKPEEGSICTDGISIHQNVRDWQNLVGYIPQSIFLTDDTVRRNIAFGVPDHLIDDEKLERAIDLAQLREFIEQLPDGLQTIVGERGVRLSGGQRQRIGIARVLYHEREVLILDEATSALDNETEASISEAIQSLSGMKTLIIIAHRLTTVENCDVVYMLEKGRIVKAGSYREVVAVK